jgi:radical SAM superfamily enzyme YgiQ (UPF0313 family)
MSLKSPNGRPIRILFISAYRGISLATAALYESVRNGYGSAPPPVCLFRDYTDVETQVDDSPIRDLLLFAPDLIACSAFFWTFDRNLRLASRLKAIRPGLTVVMGGPELGDVDHARGVLEEHPQIDVAVCGEADFAFRDLLARLHEGQTPADMPGIVYRDGASVHAGPPARPIRDLSGLPIAYHEGSEYVLSRLRKDDMVPVETLRGCSSGCDYCLYATGGLRYHELSKVEAELSFLRSAGARRVRICDSHFGGTRKRAMELFKILEHSGPGISYHIYPHIAHIDEEYVRAAQQAGCRFVSIGLQSSDPAITKAVHRPTDLDRIREAYALLRRYDMEPQVDIIYGFPGQTAGSLSGDIRFLREIGARRVLFSPLMVFPGTPFHEERETRGVGVFASPQNFGYCRGGGIEGHADLMRRIRAHRLAEAFPRTTAFLEDRTATSLSELLAEWRERTEYQALTDSLAQATVNASTYLQMRRESLAESFAAVLSDELGIAGEPRQTLLSWIRVDLSLLLSGALLREGAGTGAGTPTGPRILTEKRLWQYAWRLHELAWMEPLFLDGGKTTFLFEPAQRRNRELRPEEEAMLRRFETARFLPIAERVSKRGPESELRWIEDGTLVPVELHPEGLLERYLSDEDRLRKSLDVVYVLGTGSNWDDNELRYSLRSLERNLSGLRSVYIVGHKPEWVQNVVHIPAEDPYGRNKDGNMIHKLLVACERDELSDVFISISDDQLLLSPLHAGQLRPYFEDTLHDKPLGWFERSDWRKRYSKNAVEILKRELGEEKRLFCYNSHIPCLMHKLEFAAIMRRYDYPTTPLSLKTLYYNLVLRTHKPIRNLRAQVMKPLSMEQIHERCPGKTYLSYRDEGLNEALKRFLAVSFPVPSQYEQAIVAPSPGESTDSGSGGKPGKRGRLVRRNHPAGRRSGR